MSWRTPKEEDLACEKCGQAKPPIRFTRAGKLHSVCNACATKEVPFDSKKGKYTIIKGVRHKVCTSCQWLLPLEAFRNLGGGYTSTCTDCRGILPPDRESLPSFINLYPGWLNLKFDNGLDPRSAQANPFSNPEIPEEALAV
jgi:hypothetical protein